MAKKTVNSDIYNLSQLVDDVKKVYLPDEDDTTLAIGTYGYIGAIESKRLQTQVEMTGELCNESFPSRARLERNVITHAIMANIEDINAIPAKMTAFIAVRESDIIDSIDGNTNKFVIDRECPIYLGDFEFHLEYDVILQRIYTAGNRTAYIAQYDMTRENPSSTITNPYLSAPAVMYINNEAYIYLTVIVSQVEHNTEYKKLVTSNIIDNKTINFEFENQLAYFEVHCSESDEDFYLTPLFEGSAVPEGTIYYCWYQYIDTNLIRVRFDRNSYMPGLNTQIEVLYKTTQGSDGNFSYDGDTYVNLESEIYGYRGITALFVPVSESKNGRDRKSKKELQGLIPKELLARGSLTTITDLNNYFGMLDSEYGRIIIQKKIDNQIERVYYAYLVLKDDNLNIIPTNTIDLKINMDQLIESRLYESQSPRYILRSGACIRMDENGVGYISDAPIQNVGLSYTMESLARGKNVTIVFKAKVADDSYAQMSVSGSVNGVYSAIVSMPKASIEDNTTVIDNDEPVIIEDYMQVSPGQVIIFEYEYTSVNENSTLTIDDELNDYFTFEGGAYYILNDTGVQIALDSASKEHLHFDIENEVSGARYVIRIPVRINATANDVDTNILSNKITLVESAGEESGEENSTEKEYTLYVPTISQDVTPETLTNGTIITYTFKYLSTSNSIAPTVKMELSRGLEYVPFSTSIEYQDGPSYTTIEPTEEDVTEEAGFIYTNPYSIAITGYHLYSAFYMMSISENPYLHFEYINQKSNIQFISTNVLWNRPFLGYDKDLYTLQITLTQSVQDDLGLITEDGNALVKCVAVFYRDGKAYRYRTLDLTSMDTGQYSFTFTKSFIANDMLDNDNNIRVEDVQVPGQLETDAVVSEYGYFNPTTELKIYALCALPDIEGKYTRHDLDAVVPGLDIDDEGKSWTVTNVYEVVNGVTFYHNYSEIMGSRVEPFGITDDEGVMTTVQGYYIKGVPVFGYDYCQDEYMVQNAIDTLNYRKAYIDNTLTLLENSFGIDFKFFNTYGKSHTYYIIRDTDKDNTLDDAKEYIDRINLTMYFRVKLVVSNDSYTRNNIINDIKEYIEDLNDLGDLHIPNLVTQITNTYQENITYFEYLGFNSYGPDIQHIFKDPDSEIGIHTPPEFLNINNIKNVDNTLVPDINIYVSEV